MKKLNMTKAATIIGGTFRTCSSTTYEKTVIGGTTMCAAVSQCTNKYGRSEKTYRLVANQRCGITA
ncbi:DUF4762 family protein [Serratia sp. NPDC078593]|uniref:DUF4762 family protein n=1 Tax=unclassified Serratia (in: enterobacteria) TaxID=2647522 RepID=UPI0037D0D673